MGGCSSSSGAAYVEKPKSGIYNGEYVVDGVVIPRRKLSEAEAARRGITSEKQYRRSTGPLLMKLHGRGERLSSFEKAPTLF